MGEGDIYEIWLVRHGETEWSRSGKHTSTTELPLLPEGEQVARGLRERLNDTDFKLVLTSPRQRARTTATLAGHDDAEVDADLAEWSYGDYEGITTPEIRETVPGLDRLVPPVSRRGELGAGRGAARPRRRAAARRSTVRRSSSATATRCGPSPRAGWGCR